MHDRGSTLRARGRAWRALPRAERAETLIAAAAIPLFALAVRVMGLPISVRLAESVGTRRPGSAGETARAQSVRAVRRAAAYSPLSGSCLSRSLALGYLLSRRGVPAQVRVGVRVAPAFHAHAWVEADGSVLYDPGELRDGYAALPDTRPT